MTYDVWDADELAGNPNSVPDANYLAQYKAVIYQTGNNYYPNGTFTVPTPLTQLDMDALTEYANDGGPILAFGQDLAAVAQGNGANVSFFYGTTLGAKFLQDSINAGKVFTNTAQLLTGVPNSPYRDMNFDISARGDGADNQAFIDEVAAGCVRSRLTDDGLPRVHPAPAVRHSAATTKARVTWRWQPPSVRRSNGRG